MASPSLPNPNKKPEDDPQASATSKSSVSVSSKQQGKFTKPSLNKTGLFTKSMSVFTIREPITHGHVVQREEIYFR